jgi:exosortase/archaeosortase family protein
MPENLLARFKKIKAEKRFEPIIDTMLFITITLVIHFTYRYWERASYFSIFGVPVLPYQMFEWFTDIVFKHTRAVVDLILPIQTVDRIFYFTNSCSVQIVASCSGVKQMLQFLLLMLLYPGPWKHKAWYIPMGLVLIHLTNVFRLSGLCVVMANWPEHWKLAHDYPFRIIFYVVIFFLWVIWNDRYYHKKSKTKVKS